MWRFLTAGESHGPALLGIVEGVPAGLPLEAFDLQADLDRRRAGYGRSERMRIERDRVEVLAGLHQGRTTGAPLALRIVNEGRRGWRAASGVRRVPRPGHADLAGGWKYGLADLEVVAERASARETAMRVAVGAVARRLLTEIEVRIFSYVEAVGEVVADVSGMDGEELQAKAERTALRCPDEAAAARMVQLVDEARERGETLGGVFVVRAEGVLPGLGSYVHWERRLDGLLAQAVMSIPGVKGVEIGPAFANTRLPGSRVHDPILPADAGTITRPTNRAGGIEGGVSNGRPILLRAAMKPLPTLREGLPSVDLDTLAPTPAPYRRADICAVPAAAVVGEAMVAWVLAGALLEKFGGDTLAELHRAVAAYLRGLPWR